MFGYIRPYKPELKGEDKDRYLSSYCLLCNKLKDDYGFLAKYLLNYDITFLLLYLNYYYDNEDIQKYNVRCPYNPIKVRTLSCSKNALSYSAFINYWLVTEKLMDDVNDERNPFKFIIYKYLTSKKKFKEKKSIYFGKITHLTEMLQKVYEDENSMADSFDFDRVTNAFGAFFSEIFYFKIAKNSDKVDKLLFQIGKWVYIIDAYDDYDEDVRRKKFNILCSLNDNASNDKGILFEKAFSLHIQLSNKINSILSDFDKEIEDSIIRNILTYGLNYVFYRITQTKYKEYLGRLRQNERSLFKSLDE